MVEDIIINALKEDIGDGDHSSLACVPEAAKGKAKLIIKDEGILAGVAILFVALILDRVVQGKKRV